MPPILPEPLSAAPDPQRPILAHPRLHQSHSISLKLIRIIHPHDQLLTTPPIMAYPVSTKPTADPNYQRERAMIISGQINFIGGRSPMIKLV